MARDGRRANTSGNNQANDLRAIYGDEDGTVINAGAGNDTLRGGNYDDILTGGAGSDKMFGGRGADQFRFFGDQIEGGRDTDFIYDLNFGDGDTLVFGTFGANTFADTAGVNAFAGGSAAIISSFQGIVNAAAGSDSVTAYRESNTNDNLILVVTDADGELQQIVITGGYSQYLAAGGTDGL
jgi:Ca2+-binding RTX toxin-like protein